jgi:hypothetical protein
MTPHRMTTTSLSFSCLDSNLIKRSSVPNFFFFILFEIAFRFIRVTRFTGLLLLWWQILVILPREIYLCHSLAQSVVWGQPQILLGFQRFRRALVPTIHFRFAHIDHSTGPYAIVVVLPLMYQECATDHQERQCTICHPSEQLGGYTPG